MNEEIKTKDKEASNSLELVFIDRAKLETALKTTLAGGLMLCGRDGDRGNDSGACRLPAAYTEKEIADATAANKCLRITSNFLAYCVMETFRQHLR